MKVTLDTITVFEGKPVVYVKILDDADKVIDTMSVYYKDKASFELAVNSKLTALESKDAEKISATQIEVEEVLTKVTAEKATP